MSSGLDINFVRESYKKLSDAELIRKATQDAHGLTLEAMQVVKDEIHARGLEINVAKSIEAQNKRHTLAEIDAYCDIIAILPCSVCQRSDDRLNGAMVAKVMSFIFFTQYIKKLKVLCPSCLDKANRNAMAITLILGWWGFPWGIVRSIDAISVNSRSRRTNHLLTHNDHLRGFALSKIGELEAHRENSAKLRDIIYWQNKQ